jgi:hypothetical protein
MQRACAILSSVPCPVLQYFFTSSHKGHDFQKQLYGRKMCVYMFKNTKFFLNLFSFNETFS